MLEEHAKLHLREFAREPDDTRLVEALSWIGLSAYGEMSGRPPEDILEELADGLRERIEAATEPRAQLELLSEYLSVECGFRGNRQGYYEPENSHLHHVLERRLGIPITLSVIYIEVARRLGIHLAGISFPYHFLVRSLDMPDVFLDPFHGGRLMTLEDCHQLLHQLSGGKIGFHDRFIEPVSSLELLVRVLRNLKLVHLRDGAIDDAILQIDLIIALAPGVMSEIRDRGLLHLQQGHIHEAITDLEAYLEARPEAEDRLHVEQNLQRALAQRLKFN